MSMSGNGAPQPIVVDCDPGQDDALALLLAWGSDRIDLRAVTTVGGNCSARQGARNALGLRLLAGRPETPIAVGLDCDRAFGDLPRSFVHGPKGIEGFDLPDGGEPPDDVDGVELLLEHVRATPGLILCALGPLTNVAEALGRDRAAFDHIRRIAIMGGSTERGNRTPSAEFNIWVDPEAADTVLSSGLPISMVGLNTTYRALIPPEVIAEIAAMPNAAGPAVAGLLESYGRRYKARFGFATPPVHDLLVTAELVDPGMIAFARANVVVELEGRFTRGATVVDLKSVTGRPANIDIAVGVDTTRLWGCFIQALRSLP
jgi:inosine-uridine nucleoside N-ribohydrolase